MCVFRVSSRESSLRSSTWPGRTTVSLMTPLTSWTLWLWYGPNGPDRTSLWWYTAGTSASPRVIWRRWQTPLVTSFFFLCCLLLQRGHWSDRGSYHDGDGVVFNGERPASVSPRYRQDHERPEGHDDPNTCMCYSWISCFRFPQL